MVQKKISIPICPCFGQSFRVDFSMFGGGSYLWTLYCYYLIFEKFWCHTQLYNFVHNSSILWVVVGTEVWHMDPPSPFHQPQLVILTSCGQNCVIGYGTGITPLSPSWGHCLALFDLGCGTRQWHWDPNL